VVDPIDPIDGTRGFAHGLPEFAIRVALLRHDAPGSGPSVQPGHRPIFEAERGCGAWCGDAPLRVSARAALQGAPAVEPHRNAAAQLAGAHARGRPSPTSARSRASWLWSPPGASTA
jgi:fructose-1,6-bisphosphatase/inositol monophosphatase family enzyme